MLLMTQNMLSCYAQFVIYKLIYRLTQLKFIELEIVIGTIFYKEITQQKYQLEMLDKLLILIE